MLTTLLALIVSTASAQDANLDGCIDSYDDANGACVSVDADISTGLSVGSNGEVQAYASVGPDSTLGANAIIATRASFAGRSGAPGAANLGAGSIIARRTAVGSDAQIADDVTIGRASDVGARFTAGTSAQVGYGANIGDDVSIAANVPVGSLASLGNHTQLQTGATIARGVQIADSDNASNRTEVAGIVGPDTTLGKNVTMMSGTRLRKNVAVGDDVVIGTGVRIGRDATIGSNVTLESNVRIAAGATIGDGNTISSGTRIARNEVIDPIAGAAVVDQHTSSSSPFQTVYRMEPQVVPSGVDLRIWYRDLCEDAGLKPVSCDYTHWGGAGGPYDARAWNAVILERSYWSCNVSSGVRGRTNWTNLATFHTPNNTTEGIYSEELGSIQPGETTNPVCTDAL